MKRIGPACCVQASIFLQYLCSYYYAYSDFTCHLQLQMTATQNLMQSLALLVGQGSHYPTSRMNYKNNEFTSHSPARNRKNAVSKPDESCSVNSHSGI